MCAHVFVCVRTHTCMHIWRPAVGVMFFLQLFPLKSLRDCLIEHGTHQFGKTSRHPPVSVFTHVDVVLCCRDLFLVAENELRPSCLGVKPLSFWGISLLSEILLLIVGLFYCKVN